MIPVILKETRAKNQEDDRMVTLSGSLSPTTYGRYEIAEPESGWDSLLSGVGTAGEV